MTPAFNGKLLSSIDYSVLPHRDCCIRPPRDGNPFYPLPPSFDAMPDWMQGLDSGGAVLVLPERLLRALD